MRRVLAGVAAVAVVAAALSACSTSRGGSGGATSTITVNADGAAAPTFTRNFNLVSPAGNVPAATYMFYEPLVRVDVQHGNVVKPWLAKAWSYGDGGRTLTFRLRDDVTWSDGKPFVAKDVAFTFEIPVRNPKLGAAPIGFSSVATPDEHTVVVTYPKPAYHDLSAYATRWIVPEHLWAGKNLASWTNPDPVGTGPYTLASFSPQQITLSVRKHPWQGAFHGVRTVRLRSYASESTIQQELLKNTLTWSTITWQDAKNEFVAKGKDNHYGGFAESGSTGLLFNCQQAPTSDVNVRRALYDAVDPAALISLFDNGATPPSPTGLAPATWNRYLAPEFRDRTHTADPAKARKELAASGFTVRGGKLVKGGKAYPVRLTVVSEYTDWKARAPGIVQAWKKVLGLDATVAEIPASQYAAHQTEGDFTVLYGFLAGGTDIVNALNPVLNSALSADGKPATGDFSRYRNAQVDKLLADMAGTNDEAALRTAAYAVERAVVRDVPFGTLNGNADGIEYNATDWGGWPDPASADHQPRITGPDGVLTMRDLTAKH
ncbi:ABC transporter substrate-binding protein [Actinocatenispora rupis]|uniref:Peptide ABC transporter substrate-binding protein n=1 Tax=Actinocatenispora rupis TaxID=519421 RepID=A0A8J3IXB5_9ACTN|nr:ABC transporter substrate-binding protein [Actinocatenispora rupis]GID10388.1 peptide ABC transporter substrate-binding protein [Actinocatenispora rupis]